MSGVLDGQSVDAAITNAAFLAKNGDDTAIGVIGLNNTTDANSGAAIANTQGYINKLADVDGVASESDANAKNYSSNNYITDGTSRKEAIEALDSSMGVKFDPITGHSHDGTAGNGPKITAANLDGVPLKGYYLQGVEITSITAMGSSKVITTLMTGKTASAGSTSVGVVVTVPYNKVILKQGSTATNAGDDIKDADGNIVYGRVTESAGVWTLSFYVNIAGTETAYSFTTSATVDWYYQELFNPMVGSPVYSEMATIPSDNVTADVVDATEAVAGKVALAGVAPGAIASTGDKGTSSKAAKEDHTHEGVLSVNTRKGAVTLTSTDVGLANVTNDEQIPKSIVTTKGDLIVATGSATPVRLPIGTDTYVLTADSAQASGVKWAASSGGGGSVTSVTATAPLASSGGATPDISLTGIVPTNKGGTGVSSTATYPNIGTVATDTNAITFTAKDYDGGTASNTSRFTIPKNTTSNLSGLTRKQGTLVYDTTVGKPYYDDGTNLKSIGGVSAWATSTAYAVDDVVSYNQQVFICISAHTSGTFGNDYNQSGRWVLSSKNANQFNTGSTFESGNPDFWTLSTISGYSAGTWPTAAPTASGTPTVTSTSPISGTKSLQLTTATQFTLGTGLQYQIISVDNAIKGKVVNLSFDYQINAGASNLNLSGTSANTFYVGIYDTTNAAWIQTSNTYGINSIGTALYNSTFQMPYNTSSIIAVIFCANLNTSGTTTIVFDNFELSRKIAPTGAAVTDPVQYTPIFGAGYGTVTNQKIYWTQSGKFMRVFGTATAGTTTVGTGEISLPSGKFVDVNFYQASAKNLVGGIRPIINTGGAGSGGSTQRLGFDGTNIDKVWLTSSSAQDVAGGTFAKTGVNSAFSTSDTLNIDFTVPIAGWSSNVQLSSDAGNSQIVFSGSKSSTQVITAAVTDITFTTIKDSSGSWSGSVFTVNAPGDYSVSGSLTDNASTTQLIYVYLNGAISKTLGYMSAGNAMCGNAVLPNLKAGDVISLRSSASTTISANAGQNLSIFKLSNPQTIAANDTIAAVYKSTAAGSIGTSFTQQSFATKIQDTHGAWNGNTFTVPTPGTYKVSSSIRTGNVTLGATQGYSVAVYKNGAVFMVLGQIIGNGGTNNNYSAGGSIEVSCLAGDTLSIYAVSSVAATQNSTDNYNYVSILRVGN